MTAQLSDREHAILEFEARWQQPGGAKEQAIRAELALAPARYYQLLSRLTETARALEHDPMLVGRLRRMQEAGAQRRLARTTGATL